MTKRILCISDLHEPYGHPDTPAFLAELKKKYKPDRVVLLGDEVDNHAISFHAHDPDLLSPGDELEAAIDRLQPVYKLFPNADIMDSNHGSLIVRKAVASGLSRKFLKPIGSVIRAPKGWKWHNRLILNAPNNQRIMFFHGANSNALPVAQRNGMSYVQGHFHSRADIQYGSSPDRLIWAMTVGCAIDDKAYAFAYNKVHPQRPIIGHGFIENGLPKLLPMLLNPGGKWTGYVP